MQTKRVPYTFTRRGYFYFTRRIPTDLSHHYDTDRIIEGLCTKSPSVARTRSLIAAAKLDEYWHGLRVANPDIPGKHRLRILQHNRQNAGRLPEESFEFGPKLSEALQIYFTQKGNGKSKVFFNINSRACGYVIEVVGDKKLGEYTRRDALAFRDALQGKGLVGSSIGRLLNCISAIINYGIQELALSISNPFAGLYHDKNAGVKKRKPIPVLKVHTIQAACRQLDDDRRHLIALISDTGMRLAEAAGLHCKDFDLEGEIPCINIREHAWRSLKTASSERTIPLVGAALWAAKRVMEDRSGEGLAFPRYNKADITNANAASATLNKWLRSYVDPDCTLHSFRHSMRDRLRSAECPADIVDQIGGWSTAGIGQSYGTGYPVAVLEKWMRKIALSANGS